MGVISITHFVFIISGVISSGIEHDEMLPLSVDIQLFPSSVYKEGPAVCVCVCACFLHVNLHSPMGTATQPHSEIVRSHRPHFQKRRWKEKPNAT